MSTATIAAPFVHASVKRRKNTWYSIKDGNWTDPNTWISNGRKRWNYPGQSPIQQTYPPYGDDIHINHVVTMNGTSSYNINNLYVTGTLLMDGSGNKNLFIRGNIQAPGTINFTTGTTVGLYLFNNNHYIVSFIGGTNSTVYYYSNNKYDQHILTGITHRHIYTSGAGTKYAASDVITTGNANIGDFGAGASQTTEMLGYNLTVGGNTVIFGSLSKTQAGSLIFIGQLLNDVQTNAINFSGNPTVECRGGISLKQLVSGTGQWTFSTNSQSAGFLGVCQFNGAIVIQGPIIVTVSGNSAMLIGATINGTDVNSKLVNSGQITFLNNNAQMSTGIFDFTTNANIINYAGSGTYTLPATSYRSLVIGGSSAKTISGNTSINGAMTVNTIFALSTFNIDFLGTFQYVGELNKTGGGNVLFTGLLSGSGTIDFPGNPTVEMRGGYSISGGTVNTGTGLWTFSTSNQSLTHTNTFAFTFSGAVLISGAITITFVSTSRTINFLGALNGNNAASKFDNRGIVNYQNATAPMITGLLETNAAANTFKYNLLGVQDVKGGTYRTIEFGGSGVKTLQGNVIINVTGGGSQSTTGTASVNLNGFTITTI